MTRHALGPMWEWAIAGAILCGAAVANAVVWWVG
jgi:hypothetical protein